MPDRDPFFFDFAPDCLSDNQTKALSFIDGPGGKGAENRFLQAASEFFLHPLGVEFDYVSYDFFSAIESHVYPTIINPRFNLKLAIKKELFSALFSGLSAAPEHIRFSLSGESPYPTLLHEDISGNISTSEGLFFKSEQETFQEILDSGVIERINVEMRHSIGLLKLTIDNGFQLLFEKFDGDRHAHSFLFNGDEFLERVVEHFESASLGFEHIETAS